MLHKYHLKLFKYRLKQLMYYFVSDRNFRIRKFRKYFGYYPNLKQPVSFNEKILCRMLGPEKSDYTLMADKLSARKYVSQKVGDEFLVPLIGIFPTVDSIPFDQLPQQFVLKCNHDSGSVVICKDKKQFVKENAKRKLKFSISRNMYYHTREWQYKNINPVIMCEEFIDMGLQRINDYTPSVYRVHCFHGKSLYIEVEYLDVNEKRYVTVYDNEWNPLPLQLRFPAVPELPRVPQRYKEMLGIAESLVKHIDYCRVDFYLTEDKLYFSEFTFSPSNGYEKFTPQEWDNIFGAAWDIRL